MQKEKYFYVAEDYKLSEELVESLIIDFFSEIEKGYADSFYERNPDGVTRTLKFVSRTNPVVTLGTQAFDIVFKGGETETVEIAGQIFNVAATGAIAAAIIASLYITGPVTAFVVGTGVSIVWGLSGLDSFFESIFDYDLSTVEIDLQLHDAHGNHVGGVLYPDGLPGQGSPRQKLQLALVDLVEHSGEIVSQGDETFTLPKIEVGDSIYVTKSVFKEKFGILDGSFLDDLAISMGMSVNDLLSFGGEEPDGSSVQNSNYVAKMPDGDNLLVVSEDSRIHVPRPTTYNFVDEKILDVSSEKQLTLAFSPDEITILGEDVLSIEKIESPEENVALIIGNKENNTIVGTDVDKQPNGYSFDRFEKDYLLGHEGNDTIDAKGGDDYVKGGDGDDIIVGGTGNDFLWGEEGNDVIYAGLPLDDGEYTDDLRSDAISAGPGDDEIYIGVGDYANGGTGNDKVFLAGKSLDWSKEFTSNGMVLIDLTQEDSKPIELRNIEEIHFLDEEDLDKKILKLSEKQKLIHINPLTVPSTSRWRQINYVSSSDNGEYSSDDTGYVVAQFHLQDFYPDAGPIYGAAQKLADGPNDSTALHGVQSFYITANYGNFFYNEEPILTFETDPYVGNFVLTEQSEYSIFSDILAVNVYETEPFSDNWNNRIDNDWATYANWDTFEFENDLGVLVRSTDLTPSYLDNAIQSAASNELIDQVKVVANPEGYYSTLNVSLTRPVDIDRLWVSLVMKDTDLLFPGLFIKNAFTSVAKNFPDDVWSPPPLEEEDLHLAQNDDEYLPLEIPGQGGNSGGGGSSSPGQGGNSGGGGSSSPGQGGNSGGGGSSSPGQGGNSDGGGSSSPGQGGNSDGGGSSSPGQGGNSDGGGSSSPGQGGDGNMGSDFSVAMDDAFITDEDTAISGNVLTNDSDVDSDTLTASLAVYATNGTVTLQENGSFEYIPNANFNGSDSFTYTVSDGTLTDTATVNVTIDPVDDAPIATDDSATTDEDVAVKIDVLANDADVDGDSLSVDSVTQGTNGTVAINPDGTVSYAPGADFNGSDSFTYTVSDGTLTDTATVSVTVGGGNDAPVATDDVASTDEDVAVKIDVLGNDTDVDGDSLSVDSVTQGTNGTVAINPDGTVSYTPDADFNGSDSFTYTVSDGNLSDTATVTLTINAANDGPAATNDNFETDEDTAVNGNVFANDSDADGDSLTARLLIPPAHGTMTLNSDGSFEYVPNANFTGEDSFLYEVDDGELTDMATATLVVKPINDAPVAENDAFEANEDTFVSGSVLTNDSDIDSSTLTTSLVASAANGTVTLNLDGSFEYTPNENFSGSDSFTYEVSDDELSDTATVALTINPVNDAPIAKDDVFVTNEDTALNGTVLINDSDADSDTLTARLLVPPANGTVTLKADGSFEYVPRANFTGEDSFLYEVADGTSTDMGTATLMVEPVNDAPLAMNDTFVTEEDISVSGNVLKNDSDIDSKVLTASLVTSVANGTVTLNQDGSFEYTPKADFNGTDSFVYKVSDGGLSELATVSLSVSPVNDAPVAADDQATVQENTATVIDVLSNYSDVDGDTLTTALVETPLHGAITANADGTFVYVPDEGFLGSDRFTYEVSDGQLSDTATVDLLFKALSVLPSQPVPPKPQAPFFDYGQSLRFRNLGASVPQDTLGGFPLAELFDASYYLAKNPDVAVAVGNNLDAAYQHFVQFGIKEGRNPSALFSEGFYLAQNQDIAQAVDTGLIASGLEHFLLFGHKEQRDPSQLFDQSDYLTNNPDVATALAQGFVDSAFAHYTLNGINENRLSTAPLLFNEAFYLKNNPDIAAAVTQGFLADGFEHFARFGQREGRAPSEFYNEASYLALNPDVNAAVASGALTSGFQHYELYGRFEGRIAV